jgi:hypothetical protein
MTRIGLANYACALLLAAAPAGAQTGEWLRAAMEAQAQARQAEAQARAAEAQARAAEAYELGTNDLDSRRWERAIAHFDKVAKDSSRADAALYWKAYALNKLGRRDEALAALGELQKTMPQSRWLNDAKALEVEVRQAAGQPVRPEAEQDEDLKLIAINGLMQSDPERALPLLENVLTGNNSPRLKERALFVLAQSNSPKARQIITELAKGKGNPDVQRKAVQYLGLFGGAQSRQTLAEIYSATNDSAVKRQILQAYMLGRDSERLLAAAKQEKDPSLRKYAIQQLGMLHATSGLLDLYRNESSPEVKKSIISALFIAGDASTLVSLARTESDPSLKKSIVSQLSLMHSKEATDYMMEILK